MIGHEWCEEGRYERDEGTHPERSEEEEGAKLKIIRQRGWRRFFTWIYWRIQLTRLFWGQPPLHIIETFEGEITDIRLADEEEGVRR